MKKNPYFVLLILIIFGCKPERNVALRSGSINKNEIPSERDGINQNDLAEKLTSEEKIVNSLPLTDRIKPLVSFPEIAVKEGWDEEAWIKHAGKPERKRSLGRGRYVLEYFTDDLSEPLGEKVVTGLVVTILNGRTEGTRWYITEYGLPSGYEIDDKGLVVPE